MRIYVARFSSSTSTSIQMISKGNIVAVQWALEVQSATSNDGWLAELSYSPTNQTAVNNPNGIISVATLRVFQLSAVGAFQTCQNIFDAGMSMPVQAGDLIYVNTTLAGTGTGRCLFRVD